MRREFSKVVALAVAVALTGCAISPELFKRRGAQMRDDEVCSARADAENARDVRFQEAVIAEARRRGLSAARCDAMLIEQRENAAAVIGAVLLVAGAVAVAKHSGGNYVPASVEGDTRWDWDLMNGSDGRPVWVCRGIQTRQFADLARCTGKFQQDWTWPGLGDPLKSR